MLRDSLSALLNDTPGMEVVGTAADGHEALRRAAELNPDVLLLDLGLPGINGIEVTRRLQETSPGVRVVIITVHTESVLLKMSLEAGASGYVIKVAPAGDLINAIYTVMAGDVYVHPMMEPALAKSPPPDDAAASLTRREVEVLQLIARGHTNQQVAEALGISERTVRSHQTNLTAKLGLCSRVEMALYAKRRGLV